MAIFHVASDSSADLSKTTRLCHLIIILSAVVATTALASHLLVGLLKIKVPRSGYKHFGPPEKGASVILHGSSISYSGIDWNRIAGSLGKSITSCASLGSTPSEWVQASYPKSGVVRTFIVVSIVDLNEYFLSDFRADFVPINQTIRDLIEARADWPLCRKILGQYPLKTIRILFPTMGRSDGVMVGIRDWLNRLVKRRKKFSDQSKLVSEAGLVLDERISDWPSGRLLRRLAYIRAGCQGKHTFGGPKRLAMDRLFRMALQVGELTWVVLPISPSYQKEFVTTAVRKRFEMELEYFQKTWPQAQLIRLDQLPTLQDDSLFEDLVHMNRQGQQIATIAFLDQSINTLIHK